MGQRTTLDVLNAQQELVNARVSLVHAEARPGGGVLHAARGRWPAVAAVCSPCIVPVYDSNVHYQQVRDTWAGVRTPDGR